MMIIFLLVLFFGAVSSAETDYTNCSTDLRILERALYYYEPENYITLNKAFFPPGKSPSRLLRVNYNFGDDCSVAYYRSIGGFFFIQPPHIFQLTSLYFSSPDKSSTEVPKEIELTLPPECKPLVLQNDSCKCHHKDGGNYSSILDILTQQLDVYAKYSDTSYMVRESSPHIKIICYEDLKKDYFNAKVTKIFISCALLLPIFFIIMISVVVRSLHREVNIAVARPTNHGNAAALLLIGIFGECVALGMDIAAVIYAYEKSYVYEDDNITVNHSFNLYVTCITLGFDSGIALVMFLGLMYLWCSHVHKDTEKNCKLCKIFPLCCLEVVIPCCLIPCFYVIFGKLDQTEAWNMPVYAENNAENNAVNNIAVRRTQDNKVKKTIAVRRTQWILLCMLIAPLFSIGSHSGYILVAWVTEPSKTTAIALIFIAILVYSFLMFRQCYVANINADLEKPMWSCWICFYPIWQSARHFYHAMKLTIKYYSKKVVKSNEPVEQDDEPVEQEIDLVALLQSPQHTNTKKKDSSFDTQAFCIIIGWGLLISGSLTFIVISFYELPLQTLNIVEYLQNIFQIFIAAIALLITYKIFILSETDIQKFFKYIKKAYKEKRPPGAQEGVCYTEMDDMDDTEVSGALTGQLIAVVIHK